MHREEAKKAYNEDPQENCIGLIDKIFDDFESRTCDNCTYYMVDESKCGLLCNMQPSDHYVGENLMSVSPDFGCVRWQPK